MHQFRDKSAAQRELVVRRAALLPGADGRRRARLPRPRGAGGGGPARAPRADARHRASASTAASARRSSCPRHRIPEVGARVRDLQEPDRKMSTTGGSEQGTVYVLDEPDAIRRSSSARSPTRAARSSARDDKPGISNLIEILAVVRGVDAGGDRARVRRARGYGDFKTAVARGRGRLAGAGARALRTSCAATRRELEAILEAGAEKARAIAVGTLADVREAMGVGPRVRPPGA